MDSITQITLGMAVGEFVLGKKAGNKAILWGAVAGTIPDLDVMVTPFFREIDRLVIHRGFSHSLLFVLIFSPILGFLIHKIQKNPQIQLKEWIYLSFWGLFTHILLDCFTTYGTQIFIPFSNYRVAWDSIFIIDPFYTVPFLLCMIVLMFFKRTRPERRVLNYIGLGLSTGYLILALLVKFYVNQKFEDSLKTQNRTFYRYMTTPTPFNIILWRGIFEDENGYWTGYYSLFDHQDSIQFDYVERNQHLVTSVLQDPSLARLIWFADGYYCITEQDNELYFNDLRFGKLSIRAKDPGGFLFSYKIRDDVKPLSFERVPPPGKVDKELMKNFVNRVKGYSGVQ
ncbi:metal-dependent hydrolase [candidate division KSB1 bacterium]|nr:metal-dependent hydrolase [candidate division KSB1 bacterium]